MNANPRKVRLSINFAEVLKELRAKPLAETAAPGEADHTHTRDLFVCSFDELVDQLREEWLQFHNNEGDLRLEVFEDAVYLSEYVKK